MTEKKYYTFKSSKAAFTLLESLMTLLVISGSILVYNALTQSLSYHMHYLSKNDESNWLLFSKQLSVELEESRLERVEGDKLYVQIGNRHFSYGKSKADDFRKTNADGRGYQPMIYGLSAENMTLSKERVTIHLTFSSGLKRTFYYEFKKAS